MGSTWCLGDNLCLTVLQPRGLYVACQALLSRDFPGKNTGVCCHFLF